MKTKTRNNTVDLLRGFAMLLVVLGHTMTGSTTGAEDTLLFNFIWSVQMPLFFMISGYVTTYSRPAENIRQLWLLLKKRTTAYLMPWVVWTFLIRGLLLGETAFFDVKYLLWHMDAGYWFLVSLWTISFNFTVAQFLATALASEKWKYWALQGGSYGLGMIFLLSLGMWAGLSFLNIKQTLYYMLHFAVGVVFGAAESLLEKRKMLYTRAICCVAAIYVGILLNINLFRIADNVVGILLRSVAAVCGCFSLYYIARCMPKRYCAYSALAWIGRNSLGIYLSHTLFLGMMQVQVMPAMNSAQGYLVVAGKTLVTLLLSAILSWLLDRNPLIRKLCLGK